MSITRAEFIERVFEKAVEYADEAEHQDGGEFWDNFNNPDEALLDFAMYIGPYEE